MIVLKNASLVDQGSIERKDILIRSGRIESILDHISDDVISTTSADAKISPTILDCTDKIVLPGFVNMHSHSSMSILRGYGDDMRLHTWLSSKIWPIEAKLTEEDCYWGARFAFLEMIKSGITCSCDMYLHLKGIIRAAHDSGIRGYLSQAIIDTFDAERSKAAMDITKANLEHFKENITDHDGRIHLTLGPHAIYTVSKDMLVWCRKFADENNLFIHMHLSETDKEVSDCIEMYGARPVEYLEKIGFLGERLIFAHGVWLSEQEMKILKRYNATIVHNPISNMKLSVGGRFPMGHYMKNGVCLTLGTDSASSNNSLDMFETMKSASLLAKHTHINPTICNAQETYAMATQNAYDFLGIKGGLVAEGAVADLMICDLEHYSMVPATNVISNLIYSARSECIDTVICDGKILMQGRVVKDEEVIRKKIQEITSRLLY